MNFWELALGSVVPIQIFLTLRKSSSEQRKTAEIILKLSFLEVFPKIRLMGLAALL
jgi:hypothetical protein